MIPYYNVTNIPYYNVTNITWYCDINCASFRKQGPCIVYTGGAVYFSQIDPATYNRTGGPSQIYSDGFVRFNNSEGLMHRTNGPAIIKADGSKEYWIDGQLTLAEEFFLKYGVL